eukprot:363628-Chlamydomonas_euryale.AAC.5
MHLGPWSKGAVLQQTYHSCIWIARFISHRHTHIGYTPCASNSAVLSTLCAAVRLRCVLSSAQCVLLCACAVCCAQHSVCCCALALCAELSTVCAAVRLRCVLCSAHCVCCWCAAGVGGESDVVQRQPSSELHE